MSFAPRLLAPRALEKVWGSARLPAPFGAMPEAQGGAKIGEVWFDPPPELDTLLVKYIFTSEKLSVQVHPDDAQAAAFREVYGGKEECWLVIAAEPGAALGIGFDAPIAAAALHAAARDGSIERRLVWHPVRPGDFFFIPPGTVHAIGAGVSLIEIQQNSDMTYRLYDYGRPRELHLDRGLAVAHGGPHPPEHRRRVPERGTVELARARHFAAHRLDGAPDAALLAEYARPLLVLPRAGTVRIGDLAVRAGDCAIAPALADCRFAPDGLTILVRPG